MNTQKPETLLFVTYQYPYLPGEYFIEEEIKYLANSFERVLVMPARCLFWKPQGPARALPENVELYDPCDLSIFDKFGFYCAGFLYALFLLMRWRPAWSGNPSVSALALHHDFKSMFKVAVTFLALHKMLRRYQFKDGLIGYSYWRNFSAASLGLLKAKGYLERLYLRCHRVDIYHPQRWTEQNIIHHYADGIFSVSEDGYCHLTNVKGLDSSKIEVQRLGVAIPEKCASSSNDGVKRIVSVSNIVPAKRVELIAEVVSLLPMRVEWTHIGEGPDSCKIQERVKNFDDQHQATFTGRLANQDVYEFYKSNPVDLFINLSESEGVPVSIMEALAHGIPVVATDVGGTGEVVYEGNGKLIHVDAQPDEIVSKIVELFGQFNLAEVRAEARRTALSKCDSGSNYKSFCKRIL